MKKEDQLFGKIALKNNLIDEAQLKEAMALLEKGEGAVSLLNQLTAIAMLYIF